MHQRRDIELLLEPSHPCPILFHFLWLWAAPPYGIYYTLHCRKIVSANTTLKNGAILICVLAFLTLSHFVLPVSTHYQLKKCLKLHSGLTGATLLRHWLRCFRLFTPHVSQDKVVYRGHKPSQTCLLSQQMRPWSVDPYLESFKISKGPLNHVSHFNIMVLLWL